MERQIVMARDFENYVTLYGPPEETHGAMKAIVLLYEKLNGHDGPENVEHWRLDTDFVVSRLDQFQTEHWDSPNEYLSELSHKYPNVVIEWSYSGNDHEFYCSVIKNGHSLLEYETVGSRSGRKLAEKSYYLKALRLVELADVS
jgi:hypothetical protein